ncbi:nitrite reductase large subunit NirB [Dongia deserti]|uniref:nitrite reductase large subunit NirB n=1 Tax=Dongia deserti TaxID=2268030 RepID=UPI000E65D861|nr:nitrite reductase large subunit NirB [Dongia deserti]
MKEKLILIGNGMAGVRVLEELLERAPGRYEVTVFGAEPHPTYNRIMLSPVLAGEKQFEDIVTHDRAWYAQNGFDLRTGTRIESVDRTAREVVASDGSRMPYDRLVIAAGSHPILIPVPGKDLPGVITFRDIADVDAMLAAAGSGRRAVVIGGGLLGLEAANGLLARGMTVTVVHLMATVMERQLDDAAGYLLRRELERRGLAVITEANTECIFGDGRVGGVRLKDGREIPADLVVMAVGIRPNADLGKATGLATNRGLIVDDRMVTSDEAILAVGECVEHRGQSYGLVAPLYEMAKVVADQLAGRTDSVYQGSVTSTKLKVTGIDVFSAGTFGADKDAEDIVFRDAARGIYKRIVLKDDRIVGTVLYGDTADGARLFQLLRSSEDVSAERDTLVFGPALAAGGAAPDPIEAVAALPAEAEICGCNGVCKGKIVEAIGAKGLQTVEDVRTHTKASASCGSCTGLVEKLLKSTLGEAFQQGSSVKPVCGCTTYGHDEVRKLIRAKELRSIPELMQELAWTSPNGCSKCRPALNYYLLCEYPGEYRDDAQSRFVNERVHANIQKDGTYSVVPRMWGGVTSAAELRAIADVVDRYQIPTVKVTGGQRIDLLGVKKEQLPAVWADLNNAGLVSGHAYGKALRTVKTCVGSEWCRFGTQDSTAMGIALERATWGVWTPHKVKMAVSGCPRNCAEATVKDFGVVAVESGWELHVGGAAGMHVRPTDLLCKVATPPEVIEYCCAFLQLYREEGRYLERPWPWIERVGIAYLRKRIVEDAESRRALHARFRHAISFTQKDPWAERAAGAAAHEFSPLAEVVA